MDGEDGEDGLHMGHTNLQEMLVYGGLAEKRVPTLSPNLSTSIQQSNTTT